MTPSVTNALDPADQDVRKGAKNVPDQPGSPRPASGRGAGEEESQNSGQRDVRTSVRPRHTCWVIIRPMFVGVLAILVSALGCGREESSIPIQPTSTESATADKDARQVSPDALQVNDPPASEVAMLSGTENGSDSIDGAEVRDQASANQPVALADDPDALAEDPDALADDPDALAEDPDAMAEEPDALENGLDSNPIATVPSPASEPERAAVPFRMLLPMTDRVLLVDVDIRIGEMPLAQAFSRQVAAVMTEASGQKGTAEPTWQELLAHVEADPERFGRRQPINAGQYDELIRRFDLNRNRHADADEAARFLHRASGSAEPFRLIGTDHFRHVNRSDSKLFRAIDSDDNGQIDSAELKGAGRALMRMDQNADRGLSLSEAQVMQQDNDPAWNHRRTHRRGNVAMDLEGYVDWTMVSYAMDGWVGDSAVSLVASAVTAIDSDGDGSVSRQEAALLRDIEPDVSLRVEFSESGVEEAKVEVVSVRPELNFGTPIATSSHSITLSGESLRLSFDILDSPMRPNGVPPQAFAMLDANGDGFLEEGEIPEAASSELSLENLDADEDGKLTLEEINRGRASVTPIWTTQVRGRAAEFPDGIFACLDSNQDVYLSEREILAAGERLGDGAELPLPATEIPESFVVQIARGDPGQDDQTFRFTQIRNSKSDSLPAWARHMDSNGDGDISRLEFIGTPDQFNGFDENSDGFIDGQEVAAWNDKGGEG